MGVRLRLGDPHPVESLSGLLRRRECAVEQTVGETIEIVLPHELHDEQARMELDLCLRVWQSLHDWELALHPCLAVARDRVVESRCVGRPTT